MTLLGAFLGNYVLVSLPQQISEKAERDLSRVPGTQKRPSDTTPSRPPGKEAHGVHTHGHGRCRSHTQAAGLEPAPAPTVGESRYVTETLPRCCRISTFLNNSPDVFKKFKILLYQQEGTQTPLCSASLCRPRLSRVLLFLPRSVQAAEASPGKVTSRPLLTKPEKGSPIRALDDSGHA